MLSVLVLTVPSRVSTCFPKMMVNLTKQADSCEDDVEILGLFDNKCCTIGEKRNALVDMVNTPFFTFVDDDDWIADDYVQQLCTKIKEDSSVDVIVFEMTFSVNGGLKKLAKFDIVNQVEKTTDDLYTAWATHTMCWSTGFVRQSRIRFPALNFQEDVEWSKPMSALARTQGRVDKVLYHYEFNEDTSETRFTDG